jgi:beta-barrel assembly-enhancing protease
MFLRMASSRYATVLLASVLAGCAVSDTEERALGEEYVQQINAQLPLVTDPRVVGYVDALGKEIARKTDRAALDWRFHVVNSNAVNAFAVPGGFIYVNRGLIERTRSLDQLAGVLGHEIGHVVERHSVEQMKKATGANIGISLLCTLTDICDRTAAQVVINAAGSALFAKYSRADEIEADSQAVVNVIAAGIHPGGIPEFFRTLLSERRRNPNVLDNFFASHPLEESRIERTRALIAAVGDAPVRELPRDDAGFQRFKAIVAALPPAPRLPSAGSP